MQQTIEWCAHQAELGVDMAIIVAPEPFTCHADFVAELVEAVADLGRPGPPQLEGAPGGVTAQV